MYQNFIIEGLDRLGKSTLIEGIQNRYGYHLVIHYEKPKVLSTYLEATDDNVMVAQHQYQFDSFVTMFDLLENAHGPFILDRAHLGEMVYAPLYRGYPGDYVFELEQEYDLEGTRLILLTEDFTKSKHFKDDGESLGPESARAKEQELFIKAFNKSTITNKKIVCVTGEDGNFRSPEEILNEVLGEENA